MGKYVDKLPATNRNSLSLELTSAWVVVCLPATDTGARSRRWPVCEIDPKSSPREKRPAAKGRFMRRMGIGRGRGGG